LSRLSIQPGQEHKSVPNNAKRLEKTLNQRFLDGVRASPITKSMDPLPAHIRPEDEIYFRQPLPLRPMDFRARWVLGFKILIAAQGVWLPMVLIFGVLERFDEDVPIAVGLAPPCESGSRATVGGIAIPALDCWDYDTAACQRGSCRANRSSAPVTFNSPHLLNQLRKERRGRSRGCLLSQPPRLC
jgi:hypothetical protein